MGARNPPGIRKLRRRAAAVLWAEAILAATAPALGVIAAYLAAALFGFGNAWACTLVLVLAAILLGLGLWLIEPPGDQKIDRRIEAASGLKHRPLAALDDFPEDESEAAMALWQAHQRRIAVALAGARVGVLSVRAAARDKIALRGLLAMLLLTGLVVAGPDSPARLAGAFALPSSPFAGPSVSVWITPPAYAATPPLVLQPGQAVTALAGSKITIIIDGPSRAPATMLAGAAITFKTLAEQSHRADAVIQNSGLLLVGPWWHRLGRWRINAIPPGAPVLTVTGLALAANDHLGIGWTAADKYGLAGLSAELYPVGYPHALRQNFPLSTALGNGQASLNLADSPYGADEVGIVLRARNFAGVAASADSGARVTLPPPAFNDPTAFALAGLRQRLALQPDQPLPVANGLRHLAAGPPSAITSSADVQISALATAIALPAISAQAAVDRMLALEKEIEAGPDFAAAQALAASNQALLAALQRGLHGQAPLAASLQKLLQAMNQALAQHLNALQPAANNKPPGQAMDMSTLNAMAQKIAADEAAGRTQQAAQELQQLQKVLSALQSAKPMTAKQAAQQAAANAAADALSQMTKGEAALLDQTAQGTATPGEQNALQTQLNATSASLSQAGISLPGLKSAGQNMSGAARALGQQNNAQAASSEAATIADLQQAAAALDASRQNSFSTGQSGGAPMPGQSQIENAINGGPDEQSNPNFSLGGANPARAIQQQIIQDDAAPALPDATHQYYHRLLDQPQ